MDDRDKEIRDSLIAAFGEANRWLQEAAQKDIICEIDFENVVSVSQRTPCHKLTLKMYKEL